MVHDFLSVREFESRLDDLQKIIADGFTLTHQKQDQTNGRLIKAERRLDAIELRHRLVSGAKRFAFAASLTIVGGIVTGVTVAGVKWFMGW